MSGSTASSTTTTTLKLPRKLRVRVARVAAQTGRSAHAFMLEAIEQQTRLAERRREFVEAALAAEQEVLRDGLVHDGDEVLAYLHARLTGGRARRPAKKRLA
jgi:predicted transcriptional regulator